MNEPSPHQPDPAIRHLSQVERADQICDAYEREWLAGRQPRLEVYLDQVPDAERDDLWRELEVIQCDYQQRQRQASGETPGCHDTVLLNQPAAASLGQNPPVRIGRYQIERLLGQGGFGRVYLAHDARLQRLVAVKVPHAELISHAASPEAYLSEARTVANLNHPHIVSVYDVGVAANFPCYVVSRYIDGCDLATRIKAVRPGYREAAELVTTVAQALQYAHTQGVVHRDVKPGNILIDVNGKPYVVDFGLALREETIGTGPNYVGTPAYMSPEQAGGEGHRVDARTDIFSLGVVLYELLAGCRPFSGLTQVELREQLKRCDPLPLRKHAPTLPDELQRICSKALAKRVSERYASARDLADDLRHFLAASNAQTDQTTRDGDAAGDAVTNAIAPDSTATGFSTTRAVFELADQAPIKILPKGLRAFDVHDADFFLQLLPGPRDRDGLPESLRFWKSRIEEFDPDHTFPVGLIYGPSGCGKSSLVKAGLLPRLAADVIHIYVEATPDQTETRLLQGLHKVVPAMQGLSDLPATLAALRRGQGIPLGKKVLIVLDQFEQWLHAHKEEENSELVRALRQCDGIRVQCLVMVRDDFWMATTRFMRELEFQLLEGQNAAAVDLFSISHAEKVLAGFGRAFGAFGNDGESLTKIQREFLSQAVEGLMQEGKVICVRLALFGEMMKGKAWTPKSLKEVGGALGVGVMFLEETFSARTAHPSHQLHEDAARAVLKALLPDSGADIKGEIKSYQTLLEASGYARRRADFDALMGILDHDHRLITPTDSGGVEPTDDSVPPNDAVQKYYQLTHDYLVHSLRDWLNRKQQETRRGRAELRLSERAALWSGKPENRHLPSWWEHASIRLLTDQRHWTSMQRKMMSQAARVHGIRTGIVALLLAALVVSGVRLRDVMRQQQVRTDKQIKEKEIATRAEGLVQTLLNADVNQVPFVVEDINDIRHWANPLLYAELDAAADKSPQKLHLALALLPIDERQIDYLCERISNCTLNQFSVVRGALAPHQEKVTVLLWELVADDRQEAPRRFQAAAALARYAPEDVRWAQVAPFVARHLTGATSSVSFDQWLEHFRPASPHLTSPFEAVYYDQARPSKERKAATLALANYCRQDPQKLTDLILAADEATAFATLISAVRPFAAEVRQRLTGEAQAPLPPSLAVEQRDAHWRRQALAAVTLVHLGHGDDVWRLLEFSPDPSLRSSIIDYLGKFGADPVALAARLEGEADVSIRRALIQSLGGTSAADLPAAGRGRIVDLLQTLYAQDPDPGIHGSAAWALRRWGAATLPLTPTGRANLTSEDEAKLAALSQAVSAVQKQKETYARVELEAQQLAWEEQLRQQPVESPDFLREGLIVHLSFDETQGDEARNTVEGEPHVRFRGPGAPKWAPGIIEGALRLEGDGDFAGTGPLPLANQDSFSYGCWVRHEGRLPATLLSGRNIKPYEGFDLSLERDRSLQVIIAGESQDENVEQRKLHTSHYLQVQTRDPLQSESDPGWHHVLVTYDGSRRPEGVTIYVDGQAVPTVVFRDALKGTINWRDTPLIVGSRYGRYRAQGDFDDVRVYKRCLASQQVQRLYELGVEAVARSAAAERTVAQQSLLRTHYRAVDGGLQRLQQQAAAAETALREMQSTRQFIAAETAILHGPWSGDRKWYFNSQGQTLVVFRNAGASNPGSVKHSFAISSHEVTFAEYRRFMKNPGIDSAIAPTEDCPAHVVNWFQAAAYCNWLSRQDGVPEDQWIYAVNDEGVYEHGMHVKKDYLELSGYRLPTVAEWEHACRAGTTATYCFGESLPLLRNYAQYIGNSGGRSHPVQSLLPNEAGLFDMHGNVWEWTQDPTSQALTPVNADSIRVLLGGAYYLDAALVQPNTRTDYAPVETITNVGFRPARTWSSSP